MPWISTTTGVYRQSLEAEVRTAINSIHGELMVRVRQVLRLRNRQLPRR
jgi:hypothetical protein